MSQLENWSIALALNLQEWKTLLSEGGLRVAVQRLSRWTGSARFDAGCFDLAPIGKFGDPGDCIVAFLAPAQFQLCFPGDSPSGNVVDIELKTVTAFHAVDSTAIEALAADAARVGVRISGAAVADAWNCWLEPRLLARHFQSGSRLASLFGLPLPAEEQAKWVCRMSAFNGQRQESMASPAPTAFDRLLLNYAAVFDAARGYSETEEHAPRAAIALAEIAHGLDAPACDELKALATEQFAESSEPPQPEVGGEMADEAPTNEDLAVPNGGQPLDFWTRFARLAPNAFDSELTSQLLSDLLRTVHRARNGRLLPNLVVDAVRKTVNESGDNAARAHAFILGTVLGPTKVQTLAVVLDPEAIPAGIAIRTLDG